MSQLAGKLVVVTGASRGIGRAVALGLARAGARPVLVGRTRGALEELDDEIRALGGEPLLAPLDLRKSQHVDALGGMLFERFGKLDALVHAAGDPGILTPVAHMDPGELLRLLELEILSVQHLIRSLEPLLKAAAPSRALFLSCAPAVETPAYYGMSAAAKAGLEALAQVWRAELRQSRVEIGIVDPGRVKDTRTERARYAASVGEHLPDAARIATEILAILTQPEPLAPRRAFGR